MPGPADLRRFRRGADWVLVAAVGQELGVFRALAEAPAPLVTLSERLGLSRRGAEALLGALAELGLLRREEGGEYALTGQARARFIDRDAPDYEGAAMALWFTHARRWANALDEAVRRGGPVEESTAERREATEPTAEEAPPEADEKGGDEEERASRRRFLAAMDNKDPAFVRQVVSLCLERWRRNGSGTPRVLDLGGGPGTFARAFVARGARAVLFDRQEVIEIAASDYGLADLADLELRSGDFLEAFPAGPFDLILMANITHIYGPETNARLLREAAGALRPAGVLAILDFVRGLSPFASLFAITMLMNTAEGGTYGRALYEAWLADVGLEGSRFVRLDEDRHLITAVRGAEGGDRLP